MVMRLGPVSILILNIRNFRVQYLPVVSMKTGPSHPLLNVTKKNEKIGQFVKNIQKLFDTFAFKKQNF